MVLFKNPRLWLYIAGTLPPEKVFLFFGIIWGIFQVFFTPPFQAPDELNHFSRAYQVSEFRFSPQLYKNKLGGFLPGNIWTTEELFFHIPFNPEKKITKDHFINAIKIPLNIENRTFIFFPNTSLYSPVSYIPQSIGIFLGRILNLRPLVLFYLGRIFNLFAWILLIYISIKTLPIAKWLIVTLALLPMTMFEAASVSADPITIGLSFLLISYVLNLAFAENTILGKKEILSLSIISILLSFSKNVYFPMVFLILLIPIKKAANLRNYILSVSIIVGSALISVLIGALVLRNILAQIHPIEQLYGDSSLLPQVNPDKQLSFILSNITGFITMVANSFYILRLYIFQSFLGKLGWSEILISKWFYYYAASCIGIIALFEFKKEIRLTFSQRLILLVSSCLVILVFSVTMYLSWSSVGAIMIINLQGRYFIPIVPVLLLLFYGKKITLPKFVIPLVSISLILVSIAVTINTILVRYYIVYQYYTLY